MQIIPVLDLSKGQVIHAKKGSRKHYRPIQSSLCPSSHPVEIVRGYLRLYPFRTLYVADLDAIEQQGDNRDIIHDLCLEYPELEIWLDSGLSLVDHYLKRQNTPSLRIILSTESIPASTAASLMRAYCRHPFILSVDYRSGGFLGAPEGMRAQSLWPSDVIILNLDQVGTNNGISLPGGLGSQELFDQYNIYYGGGINSLADLMQLKKRGAAGALLATALHGKTVNREDLQRLGQ